MLGRRCTEWILELFSLESTDVHTLIPKQFFFCLIRAFSLSDLHLRQKPRAFFLFVCFLLTTAACCKWVNADHWTRFSWAAVFKTKIITERLCKATTSWGKPPICYSKCHLLFTTVHTKYWLQITIPVFNKTGIFRLNHLHVVPAQSDVKSLGGVQHLAQGHVNRTACYWWMGQLWWRCNRTLSAYRTGCFTERRPPQRAQTFLPLLLTHKRGKYLSYMPPNLNPPNIIINMAEFIDHLSFQRCHCFLCW